LKRDKKKNKNKDKTNRFFAHEVLTNVLLFYEVVHFVVAVVVVEVTPSIFTIVVLVV
jgi:hypothetical protein